MFKYDYFQTFYVWYEGLIMHFLDLHESLNTLYSFQVFTALDVWSQKAVAAKAVIW